MPCRHVAAHHAAATSVTGISPGSNATLFFDVATSGGKRHLVSSSSPLTSLLVFNASRIPTGGDLLNAGTTFRTFYNETATLIAHGQVYMIQSAADLTLCLTFSGTELSTAKASDKLNLSLSDDKFVSAHPSLLSSSVEQFCLGQVYLWPPPPLHHLQVFNNHGSPNAQESAVQTDQTMPR